MAQSSDDFLENQTSWGCFMALEQELENAGALVDLHQGNYKVVSYQYAAIVEKACAEIEKINELMCDKLVEASHNIRDRVYAITSHCKDFFDTEIHMPLNNEVIKPWIACTEGDDPEFWKAYHNIKREGTEANTTLEHAVHALAGLFSLLLALE